MKVNFSMAVMVVGAAVLASSVQARPDRNAYVNKKVETTTELVRHVKSDKVVMDRYMRHYGMTSQEVVSFLGGLQPSRLAATGVYTVYNVPDSGTIRMRYIRYAKGSRIFADSKGNASLILLCGNPMNLGPKNGTAANEVVAMVPMSVEVDNIRTMEVPAADMSGREDLMAMSLQDSSIAPTAMPAPDASPAPLGDFVTPGNAFNYGALLGLAGVAALPILLRDNDPEPVPEPATMAVLALGAAALLRRRKQNAAK